MAQAENLSSTTFIGPAERHFAARLPVSHAAAGQRLLSLDALRGLAMFWIIGGREFCLAVVACLYPPLFDAFETQVTHPIWEGFVAWDLVMPVFLFVVGTAMPFAMAKRVTQDGPLWPTYTRIARRFVILWLLGAVAQAIKYEPEGMELYSNALQAIAVGYLVTSLALLHLRIAGQIILFASLVLGYGALLMFVPFDGFAGGTLESTANLPRCVDEWVLGAFRRDHDFTWVLTSLGFAATVLLGALAGHLLRGPLSAKRKLALLATIGAVCLALGWLWSYYLPLNRHLWTSSMILWAGGWSFLMLAAFYAVIDVAGAKRWAFPLMVIGANALLAYVLDPLFEKSGDMVAALLIPGGPDRYLNLVSSFCELTFLWLLLWLLYRKRMFFRA